MLYLLTFYKRTNESRNVTNDFFFLEHLRYNLIRNDKNLYHAN